MNTEVLNLEIARAQAQIVDVKKDIKDYEGTLHLADIATLVMLFVFLVGFYVSDPFHLASFVAEKIQNDVIELLVYALLLSMAALMSVTIARLKRAHYVHKAKYRFGASVWKVAAVIMAFTVFAEMYNATGNQQHSQNAKAESSKTFEAIANQKVEINTGSSANNLPFLQGKLAEAETYLKDCKKTCSSWRAKAESFRAQIAAAEAQQANALKSAELAGANTANALASNLQKLKDDYLHPMIKALAALGLPASVAMQLIAAFVAIAFERMHLSASENLRDCYSRLDELENQLHGKKKETALFSEYHANDSKPLIKQPIGFNPNPVIAQQHIGIKEPTRPIGFHAQFSESKRSPLGTHEEQLPIPDFSGFRATRDVWASPAFSEPDDFGTVEKTVLSTVHARSETPKTVDAQNGLTEEAKQVERSLYPLWIAALKAGEINQGARDCKQFILERTYTKDSRSVVTMAEIERIRKEWNGRAVQSGILVPNPNYTNGKAKYILAS